MTETLLFATLLSPVVVGLVEVAKQTFKLGTQYAPITALGLGVLVGIAASPFTEMDLLLRAWAGGLAGLAAMGLFDLYKKM